ncbi:hypothetical protein HK405_000410, partial [Cladochytrium tenue]
MLSPSRPCLPPPLDTASTSRAVPVRPDLTADHGAGVDAAPCASILDFDKPPAPATLSPAGAVAAGRSTKLDTRITVLAKRLTLISFPSSKMPHCMHAIGGHIYGLYGSTLGRTSGDSDEDTSDPFFSLTETTSEVSVFVDSEVADAFTRLVGIECEWLDVSTDNFYALQIDSNDEGIEMSGRRIYDLTTPLAQACISISFRSTYQTDYIFVREKRVNLVIEKLRSNGYIVDDDREQPLPSPSIMASPASRSQASYSPLLQADDEVIHARRSFDSSASVSADSNLSLTTASTANSVPAASGTESTVSESAIANARSLPKRLVNEGPGRELRLVGLDKRMRAKWQPHLVRLMFYPGPGH